MPLTIYSFSGSLAKLHSLSLQWFPVCLCVPSCIYFSDLYLGHLAALRNILDSTHLNWTEAFEVDPQLLTTNFSDSALDLCWNTHRENFLLTFNFSWSHILTQRSHLDHLKWSYLTSSLVNHIYHFFRSSEVRRVKREVPTLSLSVLCPYPDGMGGRRASISSIHPLRRSSAPTLCPDLSLSPFFSLRLLLTNRAPSNLPLTWTALSLVDGLGITVLPSQEPSTALATAKRQKVLTHQLATKSFWFPL